jgi:hypothetical protein
VSYIAAWSRIEVGRMNNAARTQKTIEGIIAQILFVMDISGYVIARLEVQIAVLTMFVSSPLSYRGADKNC